VADRRRSDRDLGAAPRGRPGAAGDPGTGPEQLPVRAGESPWTAEEMDAVRSELAGQLRRIAREAEVLQTSIEEMMRDSGDGAGDDSADTGAKAFEREQGITLLTNTRQTLFQARHALARIGSGTYGACESCGEPIGKARLQAFPRAALCVRCKQRQERR
jgi:DnaK suppressor protein